MDATPNDSKGPLSSDSVDKPTDDFEPLSIREIALVTIDTTRTGWEADALALRVFEYPVLVRFVFSIHNRSRVVDFMCFPGSFVAERHSAIFNKDGR